MRCIYYNSCVGNKKRKSFHDLPDAVVVAVSVAVVVAVVVVLETIVVGLETVTVTCVVSSWL